MKRRGKLFAISTAALALAVMLTAAILGRHWIVEAFHIRRLASSDGDVQFSAAKALGAMKSVRAVPHLIRLLEREELKTAYDVLYHEGEILLVPLAYALYLIGPAALPELRKAEGCSKRNSEIAVIRKAITLPPDHGEVRIYLRKSPVGE